eukprot:1028832-Alexandrium_andersonii.AAC.1
MHPPGGRVQSFAAPMGPVEYFGAPAARPDCARFWARVGDPARDALWGALAVLVAFRAWVGGFNRRPPLGI